MSAISSQLSFRSSPWILNARVFNIMDSIYAIAFGLGLRTLVDAVSHDLKLTGSLIGLWEGVITLHFLKKMPKSSDPYIAYGVRLFIDFLITESIERLVLVLIWTAFGMVLADVTPPIWEEVGLRRVWRHFRRDLYTIYDKIPTVAFFPPQRTVRFLPPRQRESEELGPEPSIITPSVATSQDTPITVIPPSSSIPSESLKHRVPGYYPEDYSDTDTDRSRSRVSPRTEVNDALVSDVDESNRSSALSSPLSDIPDIEEEEQALVDLGVEEQEQEPVLPDPATPKQKPFIPMPPTPSDSAARLDIYRGVGDDVLLAKPPRQDLPNIPDSGEDGGTSDGWEKIQRGELDEDTSPKPPTPPAKDTPVVGAHIDANSFPELDFSVLDSFGNSFGPNTSTENRRESGPPPYTYHTDDNEDMYYDPPKQGTDAPDDHAEHVQNENNDDLSKMNPQQTEDPNINTGAGANPWASPDATVDAAATEKAAKKQMEEAAEAAERARKEEEERIRQEEEEKTRKEKEEQEEQKRKEDEEERIRQVEAERIRKEEEQKRKEREEEEERIRQEEEERIRKEKEEEQKRKEKEEEEERIRQEEEERIRKKKEEEEQKQKEEEQKQKKEEKKRKQEEQKRKEEEIKRKADEAAERKKKEEHDDALRKERQAAEKKKEEAAAKKQAEAEQKKKEEEEEAAAKRQQEEAEQKRKDEEEITEKKGQAEDADALEREKEEKKMQEAANHAHGETEENDAKEAARTETEQAELDNQKPEALGDQPAQEKDDDSKTLHGVEISDGQHQQRPSETETNNVQDSTIPDFMEEESVVSTATTTDTPLEVKERLERMMILRAQMVELRKRLDDLKNGGSDSQSPDVKAIERSLRKFQRQADRRYTAGVQLARYSNEEDDDDVSLEAMSPRIAGVKIEEKLEQLLTPTSHSISFKLTFGSNATKQKATVVEIMARYKLMDYTITNSKKKKEYTIQIPEERFDGWLTAYRTSVAKRDSEDGEDGWQQA